MTDNPLQTVEEWLRLAESRSSRRNPLAMALASCTTSGMPSVRIVLLRDFSVHQGFLVFYTNYRSRKGRELDANPRAAAALYWEEFGGRQLRFEGQIIKSPPEESDRYFGTRPWASRINAWVSKQSEPIDSLEALHALASEKAAEYTGTSEPLDAPGARATLPRPPFWGGYRLWIDRLELWREGKDRYHDRLCYTRALNADDQSGFVGGPWHRQRLQP